jgi:hypothetical protein
MRKVRKIPSIPFQDTLSSIIVIAYARSHVPRQSDVRVSRCWSHEYMGLSVYYLT